MARIRETCVSWLVQVRGLVQGVGFRPFIYRLAKEYGLKGWVENRNDCVQIKVQGKEENIKKFVSSIKEKAPPAANIDNIVFNKSTIEKFKDFKIIKSKNISDEITEISPDIAVCDECLGDMKRQKNRKNYPFVNCTNCGPRFTIMQDLPYDREKTTMRKFKMCDDCRKEYEDILDRRFHAQPVACTNCGPEYELIYKVDASTRQHSPQPAVRKIKGIDKIVDKVTDLIKNGKIVGIKGLGGFFIACDAQNENTVARLRQLKIREGKPFAVMFSDIDELKKLAKVNEAEEKSLLSWRRPIVILKEKKYTEELKNQHTSLFENSSVKEKIENNNKRLARSVSNGLNTIGAMLPYMPLHYLLFEKLKIPAIVFTSGNISDTPIVIDNKEAKNKLFKIIDALLMYNRDIYNRVDDSVEIVVNNKERIIRRSRGFVPNPINLKINVDGIIATGAELTNCFCVGKGNQAILSQHIGDLKNIETYEFYCKTIEQFKKLFRIKPKLVVCDMHPDYLSTKYADTSGLEKIMVQHHHAHIASCMSEHNLDEKVIGVSFDGTGYGDDGNIWGGEFLICDLLSYKRYAHFDYIPMPGGDKSIEEPWRMAVSYLYKIFGKDFLKLNLPFLKNINKKKINSLLYAIDNKINCPLTSSSGRLFDAVSAIIDLCVFAKFHAEAPMRLEAIINENYHDRYNFQINQTSNLPTKEQTISFEHTIRGIISDIYENTPPSVISAKFHWTIISVIFAVVQKMSKETGINKIVLSGGVFQNRFILEKIEEVLNKTGYQVYTHSKVPANDGGIALGQIAIGGKRCFCSKQ